jgi:hypothetical protein
MKPLLSESPTHVNAVLIGLTVTELNGQEEKQELPISVTEFKLISVKFPQSKNTCSKIVVVLLKLTDVKPLELANAKSSIVAMLDGMVIFPQATPPPY